MCVFGSAFSLRLSRNSRSPGAPKLRDVARLTGLKRLVELGIYECPDVVGMLIVSELPRLTHLSIDLSRATRVHLGFRCVAFSLTATHRLTMGILKDADSIALWLISEQGQWPKKLQLLIDTGRPRMAPWMARSVRP